VVKFEDHGARGRYISVHPVVESAGPAV
jgi:hypothetical protein